jgi:hypothetical protein
MTTPTLAGTFEETMTAVRSRLAAKEFHAAFAQLERAHVLGQRRFSFHLRVHLCMLRVAWALRDAREIRGQLLRIALVPVGHLAGRLPVGNTGGANVSAFEPMAIQDDLQRLLDGRDG